VTIFTTQGNGILRPHIQDCNEGVMKQSKFKKQPSRDDLAAALRTIRDQTQKLQAETIRRLEGVMGNVSLTYPNEGKLRFGESPATRTMNPALRQVRHRTDPG
jgi:hypothetical protein